MNYSQKSTNSFSSLSKSTNKSNSFISMPNLNRDNDNIKINNDPTNIKLITEKIFTYSKKSNIKIINKQNKKQIINNEINFPSFFVESTTLPNDDLLKDNYLDILKIETAEVVADKIIDTSLKPGWVEIKLQNRQIVYNCNVELPLSCNALMDSIIDGLNKQYKKSKRTYKSIHGKGAYELVFNTTNINNRIKEEEDLFNDYLDDVYAQKLEFEQINDIF